MSGWADAVGVGELALVPEAGEGKSAGAVPGLLDWIPMVSPEMVRPGHMGEVEEVFARVRGCCSGDGSVVRELLSWPIRHWKTETYMHGVLWLMMQIPDLRTIFLTHSDERAKHVGKRVREIADRTAVGPTRGFNEIKNWQNAAGGGIVVMSAEQSKEGHDCHLLIADDPIDEIGSQSADVRETVDRALNYSPRAACGRASLARCSSPCRGSTRTIPSGAGSCAKRCSGTTCTTRRSSTWGYPLSERSRLRCGRSSS